VLPFRNLGSRRTLSYLGEAVAAQVISKLASISCIRVVSQTSSFQYVSEDRDIRDIGKELGVDVVIDGAVRSAGRELRVTSQINDTGTGFLIWSKVSDWLKKDTLAMEEEVARTVAAVVEALCPPDLDFVGPTTGGPYFDVAAQLS
jgi:TolB-like protein